MPVRINKVTVTPTQTTVGQLVTVNVFAEDIVWNNLKTEFTNWGEVRRSFTDWNKVKNYIYSIPNPAPDENCVYCSYGNALFDVDAIEISIPGGASLQHSAIEVDQFLGEVY